MQDSIDEERSGWKVLQDRLQFDNNYLRLELEKLKAMIVQKDS